MAQNTVGSGNFHSGYIARKLGKGGIKSTAKRIDTMLSHRTDNTGYEIPVTFVKFRGVIWQLADGYKVKTKQEIEIIKRLLQELEVRIWQDLDKERQETLTKKFEK